MTIYIYIYIYIIYIYIPSQRRNLSFEPRKKYLLFYFQCFHKNLTNSRNDDSEFTQPIHLNQDMTQGQFVSGVRLIFILNFSIFFTYWLIKAEEFSLLSCLHLSWETGGDIWISFFFFFKYLNSNYEFYFYYALCAFCSRMNAWFLKNHSHVGQAEIFFISPA